MQTDNIIIVPFAFDDNAATGSNIKKREKAVEIYLQNATVATISLKKNNDGCEVVFVSNIAFDNEYIELMKKEGVNIKLIPFDCYRFRDNYPYCLSFYKLCVLRHYIDSKYKKIVLIDADTYCHGSLNSIWRNLSESAIAYDRLGSTLQIPESFPFYYYKLISKDRVPRVGGEFLAFDKPALIDFVNNCDQIFDNMVSNNISITSGDEFISSHAFAMMKNVYLFGGRYIQRLETRFYRSICKLAQLEITPIMHMPGEKNRGLKLVYKYYLKKHKMPSNKLVYRFCHIYHRAMVPFLLSIVRGTFNKELH